MTQFSNAAAADTLEDRNVVLACIKKIQKISPGATEGGHGYESDTLTVLARLLQVPRTFMVGVSISVLITDIGRRLIEDADGYGDPDAETGHPQHLRQMGRTLIDTVRDAGQHKSA